MVKCSGQTTPQTVIGKDNRNKINEQDNPKLLNTYKKDRRPFDNSNGLYSTHECNPNIRNKMIIIGNKGSPKKNKELNQKKSYRKIEIEPQNGNDSSKKIGLVKKRIQVLNKSLLNL